MGLRFVGMPLGERCIEKAHDGDVQPVEPHHRPIRFVSVVVPGPRGSDDEVALAHHRLLAVDGGVGTLPFDHEAKCGLGMSMGRSDLSRQDELEAGVERGRDPGLASESRVLEHQHPPLRLPGGDEVRPTRGAGSGFPRSASRPAGSDSPETGSRDRRVLPKAAPSRADRDADSSRCAVPRSDRSSVGLRSGRRHAKRRRNASGIGSVRSRPSGSSFAQMRTSRPSTASTSAPRSKRWYTVKLLVPHRSTWLEARRTSP